MGRVLVTGGMGFIGSNFVRMLRTAEPRTEVVNLDKLTYAGNTQNLRDLRGDRRHRFVRGDICDAGLVRRLLRGCDAIVNFAAETHVDRSIRDPAAFLRTDVFGAHTLLEEARRADVARFLQISTDEVYGSVPRGFTPEDGPINPGNPYSASKAGADRLCAAYHNTFRLPVLVTRCSNNYGPYQHPEKLIPLAVTNLLEGYPVPVYGSGRQLRDWIHVEDHCRALLAVLRRGRPGTCYNIGSGTPVPNIRIVGRILRAYRRLEGPGRLPGRDGILHVRDRPGHDLRYAMRVRRIRALGWRPRVGLADGIDATVAWYRQNAWWWRPIRAGEFARYFRRHYPSLRRDARKPAGSSGPRRRA